MNLGSGGRGLLNWGPIMRVSMLGGKLEGSGWLKEDIVPFESNIRDLKFSGKVGRGSLKFRPNFKVVREAGRGFGRWHIK